MRTTVDLTWLEGRIERWIRFGMIVEKTNVSNSATRVVFYPQSIFCFIRWASNSYGTIESRIDILQAVAPDQPCSTIPYVTPGAIILLRLSGWPKVESALRCIDAIEAYGIRPEKVCPDHWRHVHNRLAVGLEPNTYTPARHAAWIKRQQVWP